MAFCSRIKTHLRDRKVKQIHVIFIVDMEYLKKRQFVDVTNEISRISQRVICL